MIDGGTDLTDWTLSQAEGVSDDGTVIVGYGNNPDGNTEAWIARILSGLITPDGVMTSAASLGGGLRAIEYGAHDASGGLLDVAWNGACMPYRHENLSRPICFYGVGSGTVLADTPDDRGTGAALLGVAWRGMNDLRFGAGPAVTGGWANLDGDGKASFYGYGGGAFAAFGDPMAGPQFGISGAAFYLNADLDRAYMNGAGTDLSSGSTNGLGGGAEAQLGWRFKTGEGRSLTPYTNIRASHVMLDGYTETGGGFPAEIDNFDTTRATLRLGLEGRAVLSQTSEFATSLAWGRGIGSGGSGVSGTVIGLFDFAVPDPGMSGDFVEAALRAGWMNESGYVAATLGGAIQTDGTNPSVFGRITMSN